MKLGRKFSENTSFIDMFLHTFLPAILTCFVCGCVSQGIKSSEQQNLANVQFVYTNGKARSVCVAGNFNGWSKNSNCMEKNGKTWSLEMTLAPGRYQYLFLIDGQTWRRDAGALLNESNGFGGENSVLIVE